MHPVRWSFLSGLMTVLLLSLTAMAQQRGQAPVPLERLKQLAEKGNMDAQFELGQQLIRGEEADKDEKEGVKWLQKAAEQHHLEAMNELAVAYFMGSGVEKDEKQAFSWFEKAAKYGLPLAQQNVGLCYAEGTGVEKNEQEAMKWISRAAHQDYAPAQSIYGYKLEFGDGVEKNTREAAAWHLKAAQNGLIRAMTHMAYLYYTGKGVPLDYRRAEAWYRRAARSEDAMARNDFAWFLAVCPEPSFNDGENAESLARSSLEKLEEEDYQVVDTLAAALARNGKFGEAVQTQIKAIMLFEKDKEAVEKMKPEELEKLRKELSERLQTYRDQKPYVEKAHDAESDTKPLVEDRILQEEQIPRRPKQPRNNDNNRQPEIS